MGIVNAHLLSGMGVCEQMDITYMDKGRLLLSIKAVTVGSLGLDGDFA